MVGELKKWVTELVRQGGGDESLRLSRVADLVSKNFAVQPHEVAVMVITSDDRFLRFVLPPMLREVGQIPLTSTNSLAARTVRERRPEVINHFATVPHSSVFEAVPIAEDQRSEAIQKIMSAPIIHERKVWGVIQVSRKGRSTGEAGPDFTHTHLRELKAYWLCVGASGGAIAGRGQITVSLFKPHFSAAIPDSPNWLQPAQLCQCVGVNIRTTRRNPCAIFTVGHTSWAEGRVGQPIWVGWNFGIENRAGVKNDSPPEEQRCESKKSQRAFSAAQLFRRARQPFCAEAALRSRSKLRIPLKILTQNLLKTSRHPLPIRRKPYRKTLPIRTRKIKCRALRPPTSSRTRTPYHPRSDPTLPRGRFTRLPRIRMDSRAMLRANIRTRLRVFPIR